MHVPTPNIELSFSGVRTPPSLLGACRTTPAPSRTRVGFEGRRGGARSRASREGGVALLVVVMVIAIITVVVSEFAYNSSVELAAAVNFRDELRAHYLLRSATNLSRLLFKIQEQINAMTQSKVMKQNIGDLQIPHYAPYLIGAMAHAEEAEALGSLLGVQTSGAKGLGLEGGTIDAEIVSQDGKINLNCASTQQKKTQDRIAAALMALFSPVQFNPLFERPDARGEHHDRVEIVQALIDWADFDEARYEFDESGAAPEDYGYESLADPYPQKNAQYDTPGEIELVQGIDEDFTGLFGEALTVWGSCKINFNEARPEIILAAIILLAENPEEFQNPQRFLEALQLALFVYELRTTIYMSGFTDPKEAIRALEHPELVPLPELPEGMPLLVPPQGVAIHDKEFQNMFDTGNRRIWKVNVSAEVGRVRRRLEAVWDMAQTPQSSGGIGMWVYWREE